MNCAVRGSGRGCTFKLVTALEASNLTAAVFAAQHNVNPSTLSWWRSRFRGAMPSRGFVTVELPVVRPVAPPPPLRVELAGRGIVVDVPVGADLDWLRAVVEALS